MKKNIIIICMSIFALASCNNSEEPVYSCDPIINTWVKSNLSSIQKMKRSEWLQLTESKKKAAYRAFSSEEKFVFWKNRLNEILLLNWTEGEKNHINSLYKLVLDNPNWFEDGFNNSDKFADFEKIMYSWSEDAKTKFGWNKQIIGAITMSGNELLDIKGTLKINAPYKKTTRMKSTANETVSDCNCHKNNDFCGYPEICKSTTCNVKRGGCGWFLVQDCDGRCDLDI